MAGVGINDGVVFGLVGAGVKQISRISRVVGVGQNDVYVGPELSAWVQGRFSRGGDEMWQSHPWS